MITEIFKAAYSYTSPFWALQRKISKRKLIIPLLFHDIPFKHQEKFSKLLNLANSMHPFISPYEFEEIMEGKKTLNETSFLLTFDDGFSSNKNIADTVLKELKIKAVFFVCSNFIGLEAREAKEFNSKRICLGTRKIEDIPELEKPMNWNDLSSIIDQGHVIGSHSSNHSRLSTPLTAKEYISEIQDSGDLLEQKLGININWFAYPFGDITSINQSVLKVISQRYKYSFSGIRGTNDCESNPYALFRQSVKYTDSIRINKVIFNGGLSPFHIKAQTKLCSLAKDIL